MSDTKQQPSQGWKPTATIEEMREAISKVMHPMCGNMESREHNILQRFRAGQQYDRVCNPAAVLHLIQEHEMLLQKLSEANHRAEEVVVPCTPEEAGELAKQCGEELSIGGERVLTSFNGMRVEDLAAIINKAKGIKPL
jgi:anaerobic glycerol-3-phosphate dehydrogenase